MELLQAGQGSPELAPGADPELRVHLAQVILDGPGADEELAADLRVRLPLDCQADDLHFLRRAVGARGNRARAGGLAGRPQLPTRTFGEGAGPHDLEHVVGGPELLACVAPSV